MATWTPTDRTRGSACGSTAVKATFEAVTEFGFKSGLAGGEKLPFGHDHHVEARGQLVVTENLSDQSFCPVSFDRSAQLPGCRHAEPADGPAVGEGEYGEVSPVDLGAALVDRLVLDPAPDAFVPAKTLVRP